MNKFQYVASVMRPKDFAELFTEKATMPGQQVQKYNRLLIEGLAENDSYLQVVSGVPITKLNYPKTVYIGKKVEEGRIRYDYLSTLNLPAIKNILLLVGAFVKVLTSDSVNAVISDVLNVSVAYGASFAAKLRHIPFVGVVTDHPDMMVGRSNHTHARMVKHVIDSCTHYVFLTEQMNKALNHKDKPYIIIEGVSDRRISTLKIGQTKNKQCIYAGLLDVRYGVKTMVEAFILANVADAELHVYGNGSYADELINIAQKHANIIYHGNVLNDEVVAAEERAALLINPRPTDEEFTRYSFPSKNMEYMASGSPVLTTNLPGMPREYQEYVYLFDDETVEGMAKTLTEVLNTPWETLREKGEQGRRFVLDKKNNVVQARRIVEMIKQGS